LYRFFDSRCRQVVSIVNFSRLANSGDARTSWVRNPDLMLLSRGAEVVREGASRTARSERHDEVSRTFKALLSKVAAAPAIRCVLCGR
jgi:hypothetical protein